MSALALVDDPKAAPPPGPPSQSTRALPDVPRRDVEEATHRLNRMLAEFQLYGGFRDPDGMRRWGEIQRAVREVDRLRSES